uniref:Uncharacterized protein n=1 Tax=Arundo donax TaxID=35708 RepID=A0A0A9C5L5_ARUDO
MSKRHGLVRLELIEGLVYIDNCIVENC